MKVNNRFIIAVILGLLIIQRLTREDDSSSSLSKQQPRSEYHIVDYEKRVVDGVMSKRTPQNAPLPLPTPSLPKIELPKVDISSTRQDLQHYLQEVKDSISHIHLTESASRNNETGTPVINSDTVSISALDTIK